MATEAALASERLGHVALGRSSAARRRRRPARGPWVMASVVTAAAAGATTAVVGGSGAGFPRAALVSLFGSPLAGLLSRSENEGGEPRWVRGQSPRGASVAARRSRRTGLAAGYVNIPRWMDPDEEWDPTFPRGMPPPPVELPCSFVALTNLFVHSRPDLEAPLLRDRLIKKDTCFSVVEIQRVSKYPGLKYMYFLRPKEPFFKDTMPRDPSLKGYYGEDGWVCNMGIMKGKYFLKNVVKRFRDLNCRVKRGTPR